MESNFIMLVQSTYNVDTLYYDIGVESNSIWCFPLCRCCYSCWGSVVVEGTLGGGGGMEGPPGMGEYCTLLLQHDGGGRNDFSLASVKAICPQ